MSRLTDRFRANAPGSASLSRRFISLVLAGELLFGLVVGFTIAMYSARLAAEERRSSLEQVSNVVVASLIPMIADQDGMRVEAQMQSILLTDGTGQISCIRVFDGGGSLIAASSPDRDCELIASSGTAFSMFTEPQYVYSPAVVDGVTIGSIMVRFEPYDLRSFVGSHLTAAMIVIFSVGLVSAPWTAWLILRTIVEPVGDLRDGARQLAAGNRNLRLHDGRRRDEIGQLAEAFDDLTRELAEKEARIRESYAELRQAYDAEAQAKAELEQLYRMKSDFVAVASHELRTPLSVIRLYAEMLEGGELGEMPDASKEALGAISSATGRLTSIVSDLMDAALLERGLLPLEIGEVDIGALVGAAVHDVGPLAAARGVTVSLHDDCGEASVWGDELRLRQVLDNLLTNAIKYSDGAEVVDVSVSADDTACTIVVADQGRGIPAEREGELFHLFGRLDSDDNRDTAGLGLGLAISARIAEAHGGAISYKPNTNGRGSVFTLSVPISGECPVDHLSTVAIVGRDEDR